MITVKLVPRQHQPGHEGPCQEQWKHWVFCFHEKYWKALLRDKHSQPKWVGCFPCVPGTALGFCSCQWCGFAKGPVNPRLTFFIFFLTGSVCVCDDNVETDFFFFISLHPLRSAMQGFLLQSYFLFFNYSSFQNLSLLVTFELSCFGVLTSLMQISHLYLCAQH